ncbi:MAG: hypothetical protein JNM93_05225 [Bacteriovoracaceae bacterium]|nr:hypothetical protein [Bacteriovoracaceae bacterium]
MKSILLLFIGLISSTAFADQIPVEIDIFASNIGRGDRVESIGRNTADVLDHYKCQIHKHNVWIYSSYNYVEHKTLGKLANHTAGIQGIVQCEQNSYFNGCEKLKLQLIATNASKISGWEDALYTFQLQCADGKQDIFINYNYEGTEIIDNQGFNDLVQFRSEEQQFDLKKFDITTFKKNKLDLRVYKQVRRSRLNPADKR